MTFRLKALAALLSQKQASKNHYQGMIAGLDRCFGVSSYTLIRQEHDADVLSLLEAWRRTAGG